MNRAYALLDVKSVDEGDRRIFRGIATSPSLDRVNDAINPMGARYAKEIPLLHAHKHDMPVGVARLGKATKAGIPFEAEIPIIDGPPSLKERVDVAFAELKHGLVRAVSIGFRPLSKPKFNEAGGYDFEETEIIELSTVAIPAQEAAVISYVKSLDRELREAAGIFDAETIDPARTTEPAATGKTVHVVKLVDPARDRARAKPFVIRKIHRG